MRRTFFFILIPLLVSGCSEPEPASTDPLPWMQVDGWPVFAAIVNASSEPGAVYWDSSPGELCPVGRSITGLVKVFDRFGLRDVIAPHFGVYPFPPSNRTIPLEGEGPWLVAGGGGCVVPWTTNLTGIADGFKMWRYGNGGGTYQEVRIPVHVAPGETTGRALWTPGPYVWALLQLGHLSGDREGEMWGNISVTDPTGNVTRWDWYSVLGSDVWYEGYRFVDGPYTIELVLDQPAIRPTTWTYRVQFEELDDGVCQYGFEWADLCG